MARRELWECAVCRRTITCLRKETEPTPERECSSCGGPLGLVIHVADVEQERCSPRPIESKVVRA